MGAIQAIEAAGKKPGVDIKIVSIDGIRDAFVAMTQGKENCVVECNPMIGPQLFDLVDKIANGKEVPKRMIVEEGVFPQDKAAAALPDRKY
jgi:simple sugar transport system substrate-binding protein